MDAIFRHFVLDNLDEMVFVMDLDCRVIWANKKALEYFQTDLETMAGAPCYEKWGEADFCPDCPVLLTRKDEKQARTVTRKPDGHIWAMRSLPLKDEQGNLTGMAEIALDITEQAELRKELQEKEETFQELVEAVDAILWSYNIREDHWEYVSPQVKGILGYEPHDWKDLQFWINAIHPEDRSWAVDYCFACTERGESHVFEYRFQKKDGTFVWLKDKVNVEMRDGVAVRLRGIMVDVTDMKKQEEQLTFLSFHDQLTGLYNRRFFEEEMNRLDSDRQFPISIVLADVNGLKMVNDAYGHPAGDELLKRTAEVLRKSFRKEDIIARWGGDEFVVLLPNTGHDETGTICQRVMQIAAQSTKDEIPVSISLGWASKVQNEQDIQMVLQEAEEWMYKNKLTESGSARSALLKGMLKSLGEKSHETQEHLQRMQHLARRLGRALKLTPSDMNRLTLLVSLHDIGKIALPESLLRKPARLTQEEWAAVQRHPEMGYRIALATAEFSSIAEEILRHHERWDGGGYPDGLKGEAIPYLSRIVSVLDTYDALTSQRPYQTKLSKEEALAELEKNSGTQFDPEIVAVFVRLLRD